MKKIWTIIRKEWMEVFRNRMVIFTVAFLPLMMAAIPLGVLFSMQLAAGAASGGDALRGQMPEEMMGALCPAGISGMDCVQAMMVNQFMLLFMLIPVAIPGAIAAYSIVGEKTTRSLEPLLATPITTLELLLGKCLAAVVPAALATFGAYGLFAGGAWLIVANKALLAGMADARWLIAIFLVGPLMAVLAVTFAIMVSSRVNDPRVAEQVSMIIIIPVMAAFLGQIGGLFFLNQSLILVIGAVLLILDAGMFYLAARFFQRESILTRWR